MEKLPTKVSEDVLTRWAESCIHMNHLCTLVQRELPATDKNARALDLAERARKRACELFNELVEHGANKPEGYQEPSSES